MVKSCHKKWSKEEDQFLIENLNVKTNVELAEILSIKTDTVKNRVRWLKRELGITRNRFKAAFTEINGEQ